MTVQECIELNKEELIELFKYSFGPECLEIKILDYIIKEKFVDMEKKFGKRKAQEAFYNVIKYVEHLDLYLFRFHLMVILFPLVYVAEGEITGDKILQEKELQAFKNDEYVPMFPIYPSIVSIDYVVKELEEDFYWTYTNRIEFIAYIYKTLQELQDQCYLKYEIDGDYIKILELKNIFKKYF